MSRTIRSFLVLLALAALTLPAAAEDLEELLTQVGKEYAQGYVAPLIHAFGANQNSALYHTAAIPHTKLSFSVGLKVMGTNLNEDDQTFQAVIEDVDLADYLPAGHPAASGSGDVVMSGPTVFGDDETAGTMTVYANGLPVYQIETITGLVDTRWVPLAAPQLDVGGVMGLRASLRWLPSMDLGDYGESKYLGFGLAWNPGFLLQNPLPVEVAVGFFTQQIDVGDIVETEATSVYLSASRKFGPLVGYAGLAKESSSMDVSYTFDEPGYDPVDVAFSVDGVMENRLTLGATLDAPIKLNAELNMGKLTVFSAGIMFGM